MRVLIDDCEWQRRQNSLIQVKLAMTNTNAAHHVTTQTCKQISELFTNTSITDITIHNY